MPLNPFKPKTVEIETGDGETLSFVISKIPATDAREIVVKYGASIMEKMQDYERNEETMLKVMGYVFVDRGGSYLSLSTKELVNNHVPDIETLIKLEGEVMQYNISFLTAARLLPFLTGLMQKAAPFLSKMSMGLSGQSSPTEKQP